MKLAYVFFAITVSCVGAPIYYVSPAGNDANSGAQTSPWLTLQKAASKVVSGDTVRVQPGVYNENVTIAVSGTANAPIVFSGEGSNTVVRSFLLSGKGLILSNFALGNLSSTVPGLRISGADCVVDSCYINMQGKTLSAVSISGTNNIVKRCSMTGATLVPAVNVSAAAFGCLVEGCRVYDMHDVDAFRVFGVRNVIRSNEVFRCDNPNVSAWHADFIQTFGDNGEESYDILVEGNYVHDCATQIGNLTTDQANIHDWEFRNNIFARMGSALFVGVETRLYNNVFYLCSGQSSTIIFYQQPNYNSVGSEVVNNVFLMCGSTPSSAGQGTIGTSGADLTKLRIQTNYFAGTSYAPKSVSAGAFLGVGAINGSAPLFNSEGTDDFRTLPGSPLIDSGAALGFGYDRSGVARPQNGRWDIGPYEFQVTTSQVFVQIEPSSGIISSPFSLDPAGFISQNVQTTSLDGSGRLECAFKVVRAGMYVISALVNAPNDGQNSVFINLDGEPVSPKMIWDIPVTSGFETRNATWRGVGTDASPEYQDLRLRLFSGDHKLIIRGRESGVQIKSVTLQLMIGTQIPPGPPRF